MRKFYQSSWHGIPFESFAKLSSSHLPDSHFYSLFYEAFSQKYQGFENLDQSWLSLKRKTAEFIINNINIHKEDKILSIGCGLGFIEKILMDKGFSNIEVTEVSKTPLRWVLPLFPPDKVHLGFFPDCLPHDDKYNFILLGGIDYFFDNNELSKMLCSVYNRLLPGGVCLLVSWSVEAMPFSQRLVMEAKDFIRIFLDKVRIRPLGQFWGYMRQPLEFCRAMNLSGFSNFRNGILDTNTQWNTYWIEAIK